MEEINYIARMKITINFVIYPLLKSIHLIDFSFFCFESLCSTYFSIVTRCSEISSCWVVNVGNASLISLFTKFSSDIEEFLNHFICIHLSVCGSHLAVVIRNYQRSFTFSFVCFCWDWIRSIQYFLFQISLSFWANQ